MKYQVIDIQTGKVMGEYSSLRAASRRADKLDLAYGAYRYVYRVVRYNGPLDLPNPSSCAGGFGYGY